MGTADRITRLILALGIVILFFTTEYINGTIGAILLVLAGIFVVTSMMGFCPLYWPFGFNTNKEKLPKQPS